MAAPKKLFFGNDARKRILYGIISTAKAAKTTLGPRGKLAVISKGIEPQTTKDGITVIRNIMYKDDMQNIGLQIIKDASHKVAYLAGDGTTTTAILTADLCNRLNHLVNIGLNITELKSGCIKAKNLILIELDAYKTTISSTEDIFNIAKISANNDEDIALNVVKAFEGIGDDGIVTLSDSLSRKGETFVVFQNGLEIDSGWSSSLFCNKEDVCDFANPRFAIFKKPLSDKEDVYPLLEWSSKLQIPLIVIAPDFSDEILLMCSSNASQKRWQGCLVYTPGTSINDKDDISKDLSVLLDTKIIGSNITLDNISLDDHLGKCENILIKRGKSTLVGAQTNNDIMEAHLSDLRSQLAKDGEDALSEFEIEKIKQRLAHLSGGVATIKIGAFSNIDLQEKKDRYEDAICAVRAAMGDGIIPGAGTPLLKISYKLTDATKAKSTDSITEQSAMLMYYTAIKSIAKALIKSCDENIEIIIPQIINNKDLDSGFNAKTSKVCSLYKEGIIDPYNVIKYAIIYSTQAALTFMQLDCAIVSDIPNINIDKLDSIFDSDSSLLDEE